MSENIVDRLRENYLHKVFAAFSLRTDDVLVAVTDDGVDENCREALDDALDELNACTGIKTSYVVSEIPTGPAQDLGREVEEALTPATAILYHTSKSRSHCPQSHKFVMNERTDGRLKARLISITNGFADTLLNGAVNEDYEEMRKRIENIRRVTRGLVTYHLTTPEGTNLWVDPYMEMEVIDNGLIDTPGKLGNFPFGEGRSTAVKFAGTEGTLVSNHVVGAGLGRLTEPIRMEIEDGKIVSLEGGKQADTLRTAMEAADRKLGDNFSLKNPSFWLAEFAFGANAAAWRTEDGKKVLPPTSLEAEKAYDPKDTSIHIAHGANYIFGIPKDDPHYNPVEHHTDHIIQGKINLVGYDENGINIRLINHGVPIY